MGVVCLGLRGGGEGGGLNEWTGLGYSGDSCCLVLWTKIVFHAVTKLCFSAYKYGSSELLVYY